jgi:hypothetical protein
MSTGLPLRGHLLKAYEHAAIASTTSRDQFRNGEKMKTVVNPTKKHMNSNGQRGDKILDKNSVTPKEIQAWVETQRHLYAAGTLCAADIKALVKLPGWTWELTRHEGLYIVSRNPRGGNHHGRPGFSQAGRRSCYLVRK